MVVNQCKATLLAMRAIRRVIPDARLVQTEDIGRTFSTPALANQAAYENERRWLSLDLLCGRVDRTHPWFRRLIDHGVPLDDLALLGEGEGAPDIIGVNHYLTSERYLDGRLGAYPKDLRGGNGRQRYADAEAVRVALCNGGTGPAARLTEVWQRYRTPMAITEAHHGCSRDEQLRWLAEPLECRHGSPYERHSGQSRDPMVPHGSGGLEQSARRPGRNLRARRLRHPGTAAPRDGLG